MRNKIFQFFRPDALRAASRTFADKLATFEVKFPDAHLGAVVAFGNNTWRALSG
ncbi:Dyp-type peroxidase, partial [Salmonella enterica subsp. enterica serovar Virginia]|nr:Dyp-type peroxidase [Salmonella enterica subsp. enterica serovar Virginia]